MLLSKAVAEALRYLGTVRNYSPASIESYEASFDRFRRWLYQAGLPDDLRQFTGEHVFRFAESLATQGQKASTVVIRLAALSTLARTLMKLRDPRGRPYLTQNPTKTFEWPTVDQAETKFLLPEELAAFLAVPRPVRESIARDLFVDTGLRCSELCRANVGDVLIIGTHTALAVTIKGRGRRLRKRHFPISAAVAAALYEYLLSRGISSPQDAAHRDEPLLVSSAGEGYEEIPLALLEPDPRGPRAVIAEEAIEVIAATIRRDGARPRIRVQPIAGGRYVVVAGDERRRAAALAGLTTIPVVIGAGGRWTRSGLSTLMARIGKEAGITRLRVSAHKLRHTTNVFVKFARLPDGAPLDRWTRSQLLGHVNPSSTDRYEHLLPVELFEAREAQRRGLERYLGCTGSAGDEGSRVGE